MTDARRSLGLIAVASWLLIDSLRAAGPLLWDLSDPSPTPALIAVGAVAAAGAGIAWLASVAAQFFSHGGTVWFMLAVTAGFRFALPALDGVWLIGAGLYLAALALATVVLAARATLGSGNGPALLAGTALGAAAAVAEQAFLRTLDAVWRTDVWGWAALGVVFVLAMFNGWRCHDLKPAANVRGWWAYGLYWALVIYAFANLGYVASESEMRLSVAAPLAIVGLLAGARLASAAGVFPGALRIGLMTVGAASLAVMALVPGTAALVALPLAAALSTLAAALMMRAEKGSTLRSLGAWAVFVAAVVVPLLAVEVDRVAALPVRHGVLMATVGIALMMGGSLAAWHERAGHTVVRGVLPRIAVGVVVAAGASWWTYSSFEQDRLYSEDFLATPQVTSWNVHHGVTSSENGGPALDPVAIAQTLRDNPADVVMLQEVDRGSLLSGGLDMVEFLAGELQLPYSYAGSHTSQTGNAIITSRPHDGVRALELDSESGPQRGALAVTFMGATYVSTQFDASATADERAEHARELAQWSGTIGPVVIGGDFGDTAGSATVEALQGTGFVLASQALPADATLTMGDREDFLVGREVTMEDVAVVDVPWSDHPPLTAHVLTGLGGDLAPHAD
ncbi:hypothetical protein ON058_09355 [Demequina sp. B12]|uniref:endonuclease/exonuclease/phosphatase family protein n=1 Tax=Demequina sp. B12 TaxID=2992757 RepID=UPI00237B1526|nr:endonuclease/exonuclease/phosphatase family protein [Demequina sp. B12]MDE0573618.1 hypothetical protein [Demequina sp. B12]